MSGSVGGGGVSESWLFRGFFVAMNVGAHRSKRGSGNGVRLSWPLAPSFLHTFLTQQLEDTMAFRKRVLRGAQALDTGLDVKAVMILVGFLIAGTLMVVFSRPKV